MGVGASTTRGRAGAANQPHLAPRPPPVPGEGSPEPVPEAWACVLRAPSSSQPHPRTGLWAALSTNSHPDKSMDGDLFSIHLPDADSAQPSSATILLLGRGAWHLSPAPWALWPQAAVLPHPASEASGPGPSWASEHQQLAGSCHLLFSEHQSPRHFHSADLCFAQVGVDRPGCWSL